MPPEGYWIERRAQMLKDVLAPEQLAIYQRYTEQLLKVEQMQATGK
jgi:hypothetical protein